jgi:hypothetical protein
MVNMSAVSRSGCAAVSEHLFAIINSVVENEGYLRTINVNTALSVPNLMKPVPPIAKLIGCLVL